MMVVKKGRAKGLERLAKLSPGNCSGLQEAKDEMCAYKAQLWTILSKMSQNATALHSSTSR
ncbi:hypothetical protein D0859_00010 [Hortaea werneckii]|uniref:Uncharacterized protein n=1 Tax=Hortaea werneckii TaxID=91943 RepID=A0A3M7JD67_HORWE|nr:hypothetical protein D0859_00010 [Hortaea werneckii]